MVEKMSFKLSSRVRNPIIAPGVEFGVRCSGGKTSGYDAVQMLRMFNHSPPSEPQVGSGPSS